MKNCEDKTPLELAQAAGIEHIATLLQTAADKV